MPTIQHPMSRLGNKKDLNIRGQSRQGFSIALNGGMRRERTVMSADLPRTEHELAADPLPPLTMDPGRMERMERPWPGRSLAAEEDAQSMCRSWTPGRKCANMVIFFIAKVSEHGEFVVT